MEGQRRISFTHIGAFTTNPVAKRTGVDDIERFQGLTRISVGVRHRSLIEKISEINPLSGIGVDSVEESSTITQGKRQTYNLQISTIPSFANHDQTA
jgi:hypothetical protein